MNLSLATPSEVDHEYLRRLASLSVAGRELGYAEHAVVSSGGYCISTKRPYALRDEAVTVHPQSDLPRYGRVEWAAVEPHVLTVERCLNEGLCRDEVVVRYYTAVAARDAAVVACREVEDEYRRRPWQRYWLVTTSDGHIHRSRHCSSCNKGKSATGFALVPYLSGKHSADAVADLGPSLCSICYPEAPVESREQSRVSARLAVALAEEGVAAFHAARQAAAKRHGDRCAGTGQPGVTPVVVEGTPAHQADYLRRRVVECPVCRGRFTRSSTGKVRPHKAAT
jgi:hypothetical protein